jgi:HK97 family phage major capsid protein
MSIPASPTNSNLIEFTRENVFTNNAGPQYSSPNYENVTKPESGITFTLETTPVVTMAHSIPVSKQVLDDSQALEAYLGPRMLYGLALKTDDAILNGDGTSGALSGILKAGNFTAYNRAVSGDTALDTVGRAITQLALTDYVADGCVLNPEDWETIRHLKATDDQYVIGNPGEALDPVLWGCRVVITNQVAQGTFLVGAFAQGAQIFDRQQATLEMSRHDGTNFTKNMITVLAEERLALAVYRAQAFVSGSF